MSPRSFLDDFSDEESESRVRKKLRTDGIKHIECDCKHYTLDSIMLECSKCGKSQHGHCYGIHTVPVFDLEHVCGRCSREWNCNSTSGELQYFHSKKRTEEEIRAMCFRLMARRTIFSFLFKEHKGFTFGEKPGTKYLKVRFEMSTVYARKILGHLTQEGIVVFEPKFKLIPESVTEHFPDHVKRRLKSSTFSGHRVKLEEPKCTPTVGQRVRNYVDGVLIGVGRPEEIRAELERRKRHEADLRDSGIGPDVVVKSNMKAIRAINVDKNPQVKRKLVMGSGVNPEERPAVGEGVEGQDTEKGEQEKDGDSTVSIVEQTVSRGAEKRKANAEELKKIQREYDDRSFRERLEKEILDKQKVVDEELAAKKRAQELLDLELIARKDKLDRQEREIEIRAREAEAGKEDTLEEEADEEQEVTVDVVAPSGPVVSRYMTPDLSEENIRTDDAGNRYYNLFILPENFKERERGSTGIPKEPTPVSEMNPTCKGPVFGQVGRLGKGPKENKDKRGWHAEFSLCMKSEVCQVWVFGNEDRVKGLVELMRPGTYVMIEDGEIDERIGSELPINYEYKLTVNRKAVVTVLGVKKQMLGLPIVEPKSENESFARRFNQPKARRLSVKKKETEHTAAQKRRMVGADQKRMDQFLAVPGDVVMDGATGRRGETVEGTGDAGNVDEGKKVSEFLGFIEGYGVF